MKRFSIRDTNEYYFSYLYISVSLGCVHFFFVVYICRKSEKNENFDLPYVYINYEILCCKHKTKLAYISVQRKPTTKPNARRKVSQKKGKRRAPKKTKINLSKTPFLNL